jgi:XTP/dITP diphosphohydrolase
VATRNRGKAEEFGRLLGAGVSVEPLPDSVGLPEETGATFADNALLKALGAFTALGGRLPILADDSGLEVDALGGDPGVRSARYAGEGATDEQNVVLLLSRLGERGDRTARFVCALALVVPTTEPGEPRIYQVSGALEGRIGERPTGVGGFGYDPVFVPEGWDVTLAEAAPSEKDRVSHRARAVAGLLNAVASAKAVAGG